MELKVKESHDVQKMYDKLLEGLSNDKLMISENRDMIIKFLHDAKMGKTLIGRQKKKIGIPRLLRVSKILKDMSNKWFTKPFTAINEQDMTIFIERLEEGKIHSAKGKPFTYETQTTIKKFIRKFFKWLNNGSYPEFVNFIDTSERIPEIPALTRDEVEKMIDKCSTTRGKAIIMILFDGGFRAMELLNVRLKDVFLRKDEDKGEYYQIRCTTSKTRPRTISVPLSYKHLKAWLDEHPDSKNENAFLFPVEYSYLERFVRLLGKRVLNKRVTAHILRHSSATYYCNILEHYPFCHRYGWSLNSDCPKRYIDYNGIDEQKTAEKVITDEVNSYRKENQQLSERLSLLSEQMSKLHNELQEMRIKDRFVANKLREVIKKKK